MSIEEAIRIQQTEGLTSCRDGRKADILLHISKEQYEAICAIENALDNGYVLCDLRQATECIGKSRVDKLLDPNWNVDGAIDKCIELLKDSCIL